ncbi:MAG TPA: potassium channel family protein [Vicinamibacterales bacterium]
MLSKPLAGLLLMAVCVAIHAGGVTWALRKLRMGQLVPRGFWPVTWLFVLVAAWMILLHLLEIAAWGLVYLWRGAIGDLPSALYFSAVTYTTTGYGDIVLPETWRLVGGIEALTGILMCGWTTGFFFAVVNRLYEPRASANIRGSS